MHNCGKSLGGEAESCNSSSGGTQGEGKTVLTPVLAWLLAIIQAGRYAATRKPCMLLLWIIFCQNLLETSAINVCTGPWPNAHASRISHQPDEALLLRCNQSSVDCGTLCGHLLRLCPTEAQMTSGIKGKHYVEHPMVQTDHPARRQRNCEEKK